MNQNRQPIISAGQIYLNADLNEYFIVTKNTGGVVSYQGVGFTGNCEDEVFVDRFGPVDVADVDSAELKTLLKFCPVGTKASTGFTDF